MHGCFNFAQADSVDFKNYYKFSFDLLIPEISDPIGECIRSREPTPLYYQCTVSDLSKCGWCTQWLNPLAIDDILAIPIEYNLVSSSREFYRFQCRGLGAERLSNAIRNSADLPKSAPEGYQIWELANYDGTVRCTKRVLKEFQTAVCTIFTQLLPAHNTFEFYGELGQYVYENIELGMDLDIQGFERISDTNVSVDNDHFHLMCEKQEGTVYCNLYAKKPIIYIPTWTKFLATIVVSV